MKSEKELGEVSRASDGSDRGCVAAWSTMHDEYVISQFFAMCAESGNPDIWTLVDTTIEHLCRVRCGLSTESAERCRSAAFEYLHSLRHCG